MHVRCHGFTLLELLITLVISTILIVIGYPAYTHYQVEAERNRATVALMQLSARMEIYFGDNGTYKNATTQSLNAANLTAGLDYQLKIMNATDQHFTISATPINAQAKRDTMCGAFILNDLNQRSMSGYGDVSNCWR